MLKMGQGTQVDKERAIGGRSSWGMDGDGDWHCLLVLTGLGRAGSCSGRLFGSTGRAYWSGQVVHIKRPKGLPDWVWAAGGSIIK